MEAPLRFQEAVERCSCRLRRILSLPPPAPRLQVLSQSYKTSGIIAQYEGVTDPVGTLFILNREYEIHLPAGDGGENSQERTMDNGNHTVLASYGGRACERRYSISTLHVVGQNNCIKTHYGNDSRGGCAACHRVKIFFFGEILEQTTKYLNVMADSFCSLYACHHFDEETQLSASYAEALSCGPTIEIELQQEKGNFKATGKLEKNLASGLHQLHVHSKAVLPAKITLKTSVSTNLQANGYSGLDFAWASSLSTCTSCVLLRSDGTREFSVRGSQRFREATLAELSASTNFDARRSFSCKVEHKVSEENKVSMNVTSNSFSIQEASIIASFSGGQRSWKWKYRKVSEGEHVLGLEWQCQRNSDAYLLNIEARRQGIAVNGELCHFL